MPKSNKVNLFVLKKQKIKKHKKTKLKYWGLIGVLVLFIICGIWVAKEKIYSILNQNFITNTLSFRVNSKNTQLENIVINVYCLKACVNNSKLNLEEIKNFTINHIKSSKSIDIQSLTKNIHQKFNLEFVNVFQSSFKTIDISVIPYKPILKIKVGNKIRFLSDKNKIFGLVPLEDQINFVLISGILDDIEQNTFNEDGTIQVNTQNQEIINAAVNLYFSLIKAGFNKLESITYLKHRGFNVKLKEPSIEVIFDMSETEKQIAKLKNILKQPNAKNIVKIELDYKGKAFVSEL